MKNYYLHRDGQNHGPYSAGQMIQMVSSGEVGGEEPVCEEGGSQWVQASSLIQRPVPRVVGVPGIRGNPVARATAPAVTEQHVAEARLKLKTPIMGIVFSIALPCLLLAAKSDASRGVRVSGKHSGLKELFRQNVDLLPAAIVVGIIGAVVCGIWLGKAWKKYKQLKADCLRQSPRIG
jgi:hypothetical protein